MFLNNLYQYLIVGKYYMLLPLTKFLYMEEFIGI